MLKISLTEVQFYWLVNYLETKTHLSHHFETFLSGGDLLMLQEHIWVHHTTKENLSLRKNVVRIKLRRLDQPGLFNWI